MVTFSTLGQFIIDEFEFGGSEHADSTTTETHVPDQIGGGGTYAAIGARMHLPPREVKMVVDRGSDFPLEIREQLDSYGEQCWIYRDDPTRLTTKVGFIKRSPRSSEGG